MTAWLCRGFHPSSLVLKTVPMKNHWKALCDRLVLAYHCTEKVFPFGYNAVTDEVFFFFNQFCELIVNVIYLQAEHVQVLAKLRFVLELVDTLINVAESRSNPITIAMQPRKV